MLFSSLSYSLASSHGRDHSPEPDILAIPTVVGFTTSSILLKPGDAKKGTLMPSAEALAKAAATMKRWQKEMEDEFPDLVDEDEETELQNISTNILPAFQPAFRSVLGAMENSFAEREPPSTPSPVGGGFRSLSPLAHRTVQDKRGGFKSPLLSSTNAKAKGTGYVASPLNPHRAADLGKPRGTRAP